MAEVRPDGVTVVVDRVLRVQEGPFADRRLRATLGLTTTMPPREHVSTAHCIAFDGAGRVLLARHVHREWTIPGGHLEPGETPEAAIAREAMEEAAAVVADPVLFAVERIDHLEGPRDARYPDPSHQVFFVARVERLDALVPNDECTESRLVAVDEARRLPGWMDHNADLFDAALAVWAARHP